MGCDSCQPFVVQNPTRFNPRTRVGCDDFFTQIASNWGSFNPRTRVGCDACSLVNRLIKRFQSTHPCGVRPLTKLYFSTLLWFQSTHPCGVRLQTGLKILLLIGFNPRTRVGCDSNSNSTNPKRRSFNPRTRVGCDSASSAIIGATVVSIHAPVWGATRYFVMLSITIMFQSTHPCGVRLVYQFGSCRPYPFQSTHPCGVRQKNK